MTPRSVVTSPSHGRCGLSASATELYAKRLELLFELVPRVARVAFLTNMGNPNEQFNWQQIERAARVLGIRPQLLDVRKPEDFERTFNDASEQRIDALVVALDGLLSQNRQIIVDLAAKHRLPAVYGSSEFIIPGGLAAYGPSYSDLYRRAANYVDKILKGVRPADLPVELPTKFQLVINLKTSKSLGLTIPPTILARADEVIE